MNPRPLPNPDGSLTIRDDFEVRNHVGAVLLTTPNRDQAIAFLRDKMSTFPGLVVDRVTVTQQRRRAYRPRPQLVAS